MADLQAPAGVTIDYEVDVMGGHVDTPLVRWRLVFYRIDGGTLFLLEGDARELTQDEITRRLALERDKVRRLVGPREGTR